MAKVKFFASLRELVGLEEIVLDVADHRSLLSELERHLSAEGYEAISAASVKIALNHEIVELEFEIQENDAMPAAAELTRGEDRERGLAAPPLLSAKRNSSHAQRSRLTRTGDKKTDED